MIYDCVVSSRYSMEVDVYRPVKGQDPLTGKITYSYVLDKTIPCMAWGITASGKDFPGTFESMRNGTYSYLDTVRIITGEELKKDYKIANIRGVTGSLWNEDAQGLNPTIFDSRGSVPVVDAFGNLVEYATYATRSAVQSLE